MTKLAARDVYVIRLVAGPSPVEGIVRVRLLLKIALRRFGLRCVSVRVSR